MKDSFPVGFDAQCQRKSSIQVQDDCDRWSGTSAQEADRMNLWYWPQKCKQT